MSLTSRTRIPKDPLETEDYYFDFTDELAEGDTITSFVLTVQTGLTKVAEEQLGAFIRVRLSGGTAGTRYKLVCVATTAGGLVQPMTRYITMKTA
jgi:hypothetical protein